MVCVECPDEKGQTPGHMLPPAPAPPHAGVGGARVTSKRMRLNVQNKMAEGFHHSDDDEFDDEDDEEGDLDKFYAFQGSSEIMSKQRKQQQQQQQQPLHSLETVSHATTSATTATTVSKGGSSKDEYSSTLQVLKDKLREASLQLAGCNMNGGGGGLDKAQLLAKLIGDLAHAIKVVESIIQ